jgi:hypothetical protein
VTPTGMTGTTMPAKTPSTGTAVNNTAKPQTADAAEAPLADDGTTSFPVTPPNE